MPNDKALGRKISRLTLIQDLDLVSLIDGGISAPSARMTGWSAARLGITRRPGTGRTGYARRHWAHGLIWDSKRDRGGLALVLFGDRIARDFGDGYEKTLPREVTQAVGDLGQGDGLSWANERLRPYRAVISQPLA